MFVSLLKFAIIKLTRCGFYTRDYFGKSIATLTEYRYIYNNNYKFKAELVFLEIRTKALISLNLFNSINLVNLKRS